MVAFRQATLDGKYNFLSFSDLDICSDSKNELAFDVEEQLPQKN